MNTAGHNDLILINNCSYNYSDSRASKLHLLMEAREVCYRKYVGSECPLTRQTAYNDRSLFADALEALTAPDSNLSSIRSDNITKALRRAYDVQSGDAAERDNLYYDVSYGSADFHGHSHYCY